MTPYICKEGNHAFKPARCADYPAWLWSRRPMSRQAFIGYKARLRATCRYEFDNADQKDWNKLPGVSFNYLDNHINSAMLGWRWNPDVGLFEIAPYYHASGRPLRGILPIITANVGEALVYAFYVTDKEVQTVVFQEEKTTQYAPVSFEEIPTPWRKIGAWFGGNRTAPHDMHLEFDHVTDWMPGRGGRMVPVEAVGHAEIN